MRLRRLCVCLALLLAVPVAMHSDSGAARKDDDEVVDRFLAASETTVTSAVALRRLSAATRGGSMSAWLNACTYLDGTAMRYRILGEGGSGAVRKRALIAALDGEVKARREGDPSRGALVSANYDFLPEPAADGRTRVQLKPRRKDGMLVDGTMVLANDTADLLTIEGRLVKAPSFWTRKVDVVRRYARMQGVRVPVSMESTAQVLILGTSTFSMTYDYASINGAPVENAGAEAAACSSPATPATAEAAEHNERGVAAHLRRSLDEASEEYERVLSLDPPRQPSEREREIVDRLAPRVMTTHSEPFTLRDIVAVIHPDEPVIAYHLFWDDDIDYPDDNEPSDHEVVWVRYSQDGRFERLWTYFHGRILDGGDEAVADAARHGGRPLVNVQWGKHGSMPAGWQQQMIEAAANETEAGDLPAGEPITLERYNRGTFEKLRSEGARAADHPLARVNKWPRTFTGTWTDFSRFEKSVDVRARLEKQGMVLVSAWNNATINQRFLRYNFKPKIEWPWTVQSSADDYSLKR